MRAEVIATKATLRSMAFDGFFVCRQRESSRIYLEKESLTGALALRRHSGSAGPRRIHQRHIVSLMCLMNPIRDAVEKLRPRRFTSDRRRTYVRVYTLETLSTFSRASIRPLTGREHLISWRVGPVSTAYHIWRLSIAPPHHLDCL